MKGAKILVADDSATVRYQLRRVLTEAGFENLLEARDGSEAVLHLKESLPDLAILDIRMPEMDGYEVCQQIKHLGSPWTNIPIIFLTSSTSHALELLGEQWGAYVPKPVSVSRLLQIVETLLERNRGSQSPSSAEATQPMQRPSTTVLPAHSIANDA